MSSTSSERLVRVLTNAKLLRLLSNPALAVRTVLRHLPDVPVATKVAFDVYGKAPYAYGIWTAAGQARALAIPEITVIEFGVGTGVGLLAMEQIAGDVERATGIGIRVVGFDAGVGLPAPEDYRDLPYLYEEGYYVMDEPALRASLTRASLMIGPVTETVPAFLRELSAPIGFVSNDLDYYSSTRDSFAVFDAPPEVNLPRVICYFDDLSNPDALQCSYTGEALAITEFNAQHERAKIDQIHGLRNSRLIDAAWPDVMYACHFFDHPLYSRQIVPEARDYLVGLDG